MNARSLPPGWPRAVPPPTGDGWVRDAVAWLLDQCPPEYRGIPVIRQHPRVLVAFAQWQLQAQREGADRALSGVRTTLRGEDPRVVAQAIAALESEQARLELVARAIDALADAIARDQALAAG
jgi:hypothetical protein